MDIGIDRTTAIGESIEIVNGFDLFFLGIKVNQNIITLNMDG